MPETTQTPAASTPATDAPVASPPATDAPGTQVPAGYVPQAELEKAQATARGLQSEKDKLAARVAELSKPDPTTEPATKPAAAADPAAMIADLERRMELREAKAEFRSDERFKNADPSVFARATEFDSREAFEAELLASVETRTTEYERIKAEVAETILADVRAKYPDYAPGTGAPPTTQGGGTTADGPMTAERLTQMSQADFEAWVIKNPEEYNRVLSGA